MYFIIYLYIVRYIQTHYYAIPVHSPVQCPFHWMLMCEFVAVAEHIIVLM
jgi:hypothetical protein